jgi:hypothetical protein
VDLAEEPGGRGGGFLSGDDPGEAEAGCAVDGGVLPQLAHALELADVHGVEEDLLANHIGAQMPVLDVLLRAQVAQRPFGQRSALGRGQRLGGGQPHPHPVEPGGAQHEMDRAVADPPAAEPRPGQPGGDRTWALGGVLDRIRTIASRHAGDSAAGCRPLGRGLGNSPASP